MTLSCGAPPRAPDEATASDMGAISAPEDPPLGTVELPFDMAHLLTTDPTRDTAWQADGACVEVGGEPFFPETGEDARPAKRVCRGCDVQQECGDYALANRIEHGVWGGMTGRERRAILRRGWQTQRRRVAVAA